jgi:phosphoribosylformylglycinamidine synthase subunit PurL
LGILDDYTKTMTMDFKEVGDLIYLVGRDCLDLGSSEYLRVVHSMETSGAPHFDLKDELALQSAVKGLISKGLIQSAHDCSEGGLFSTLIESAMVRNLGFSIHTTKDARKDALLFGESGSRVVISIRPDRKQAFESYLQEVKHPYISLGTVVNAVVDIDSTHFGIIKDWKNIYDNRLGILMT